MPSFGYIPHRYWQLLVLLGITFTFWRTTHPSGASEWDEEEQVWRHPEDWDRYAYVQYVDNIDHLCNAVMLFDALYRLDSKADRLLLFPEGFRDESGSSTVGTKLLLKAADDYNVNIATMSDMEHDPNDAYWCETYTKVVAFSLTSYDRVIALDTDSLLLDNLDDLFDLPAAPVAMPRAYWNSTPSTNPHLSTHLMLIEPSQTNFKDILKALDLRRVPPKRPESENHLPPPPPTNPTSTTAINDYLSSAFETSALVLPHRRYNLLSLEYRLQNHNAYLSSDDPGKWEPYTIRNEAAFVHFSDYPLPKPWVEAGSLMDEYAPEGVEERNVWRGLYEEWDRRRWEVCGMRKSAGR